VLVLVIVVYLLPLVVLLEPGLANIVFIVLPLSISIASRSLTTSILSITLLPLTHNVQAFIISYACSLIISLIYVLSRGEDPAYIVIRSVHRYVKFGELVTDFKLCKTLMLASLLAYVQAVIARLNGYKLSSLIASIDIVFSTIATTLLIILLWYYYKTLNITLLAAFALSIAWSTPALALLPLTLMPTTLIEYLSQTKTRPSIEFGEVVAVLEKKPVIRYQKSLGKGFRWWWAYTPFKITYRHNILEDPNQHIAIFGTSGSGKSTLAATILLQLCHNFNIKFIVIDPHGEYKNLIKGVDYKIVDASKTAFNPLVLVTGETPAERAEQIVDVIRTLYRIGPLQASILEEAILDAYALYGLEPYTPYTGEKISFPQPNDIVKILTKHYNSKHASVHSLLKYVKGLLFHGSSSIDINLLLSENVVLDLHRLPTPTHQMFYVESVARLLVEASRREGKTNKLRRVIVIDEAHIFLPRLTRRESPLSRLFVELRKYGVIGILVTQNPLDIDERVLVNTSLKISLALNEPKALNYIARVLAGFEIEDRVEALKAMLASLPRGYAIVKPSTLTSPLLIRLKTPISADKA